jgi:hypothetical protein
MAGKFELYKDSADKYRFRLKASNGQVVATGEPDETKASALNGIESVKRIGRRTDRRPDHLTSGPSALVRAQGRARALTARVGPVRFRPSTRGAPR